MQKAGDQVRVNVQLINAVTDAHLWADIYDRKLTDIFGVESDIAKTIADTLQAKLTGSEKTAMSNTPTENSEAYELYLKGRFFWNKRTGQDLKTAAIISSEPSEMDRDYAADVHRPGGELHFRYRYSMPDSRRIIFRRRKLPRSARLSWTKLQQRRTPRSAYCFVSPM